MSEEDVKRLIKDATDEHEADFMRYGVWFAGAMVLIFGTFGCLIYWSY